MGDVITSFALFFLALACPAHQDAQAAQGGVSVRAEVGMVDGVSWRHQPPFRLEAVVPDGRRLSANAHANPRGRLLWQLGDEWIGLHAQVAAWESRYEGAQLMRLRHTPAVEVLAGGIDLGPLPIENRPIAIVGRLIDTQGRPVQGASVLPRGWLATGPAYREERHTGDILMWGFVSDADGWFAVPSDAARSPMLAAREHLVLDVVAPAGLTGLALDGVPTGSSPLHLVLEPARQGRVTIRVEAEVPTAGLVVEMSGVNGALVEVTAQQVTLGPEAKQLSFEFENAPTSNAKLRLLTPAGVLAELGTVPSGPGAFAKDFDLRGKLGQLVLEPGASGDFEPGALRVAVLSPGGRGVVTFDQGQQAVLLLPAGPQHLQVGARGALTRELPVEIPPGISTHAVELHRAPSLSLTLPGGLELPADLELCVLAQRSDRCRSFPLGMGQDVALPSSSPWSRGPDFQVPLEMGLGVHLQLDWRVRLSSDSQPDVVGIRLGTEFLQAPGEAGRAQSQLDFESGLQHLLPRRPGGLGGR